MRCTLTCVWLAICSQVAMGQGERVDDILQHVPMATTIVMKACGAPSQSATWKEFAASAGASYIIAAGTAWTLKQCVHEKRPDGSDYHSFPSGHTTFAFAGASVLRHEYGHLSPWISVGGYGLATLVAIDRVRQDRHYIHDACAGAAIGTLGTELTYYIKRKLLKSENVDVAFTGNAFSVRMNW